MDERSIKIIKRNTASGKEPFAYVAKAATIAHRERIELVNDWIAESRENARLEKAFSEIELLGWKMNSPRIP